MAITLIDLICPTCSKGFSIRLAYYTRAQKVGRLSYCGRKCAGIARRCNRTPEEWKEIKRLYDIEYQEKNRDKRRAQNKAWFDQDYAKNPEKHKARRKDKQASHNEYCRTPKYRAWKHQYDQEHCAKKSFGEFWESALLVKAIDSKIDKFEAMSTKGTINKAQKRKRKKKYF